MHYTIFIPGIANLSEADKRWEELGLNSLCRLGDEATESPVRAMTQGATPGDAKPGVYFGWQGRGPAFDSAFQHDMTWRKCAAMEGRERGDYWIGWHKGQKPRPADLCRWREYGAGYGRQGR